MAASIVQAQYDELEKIAQRFQTQSDVSQQLQQLVAKHVQGLQSTWLGDAADAFQSEMQADVMPAVMRLIDLFAVASQATTQIKDTLEQAEEEARDVFSNWAIDGEVGSGGGGAGAVGGGAPGGAPGGGGGGGGSGGGASTQQPIPANQLFQEKYMDSLIGKTWKGEGNPALNSAMETLTSGNPSPQQVSQALDSIAEARGLPRDQVQAQYEKFLQLREESNRIGGENGNSPAEAINQDRHPDFMGSRGNLRYGQVVGDAFGIDPVFGAMLNPSGGLVGPGNNALDLGDRGVAYHGAVHDAAGYLYNYHNQGPGYDYLGQEGRSTGNPLTGQSSGIPYWNDKIGAGRLERFATETAGSGMGGVVDVTTWAGNAKQTVVDGWNKTKDWFSDLF